MQISSTLHRWNLCNRNVSYFCLSEPSIRALSTTSSRSNARKWDCGYDCDIPAEPLYRYRAGGYHPVKIGDCFQENRYRVLQKLGWGGFSTTWAARDERVQKNVAMKITTAGSSHTSQEVGIMLALADSKLTHPGGSEHIRSLYDHFQIHGPNGVHECLVLELLGPDVPDLIERLPRRRLPATLAKTAARQTLRALEALHQRGIVHGDVHVRNLACTLPDLQTCSERDIIHFLGAPDIALVRRRSGEPAEAGMPEYLVSSASFPQGLSLDSSSSFKLIDLGEAFFERDPPGTIHTPLVVRAPEVILGERADHRVDLWGMGCLLFELVIGQPLFDNVLITVPSLVNEMLDTTGYVLPERWRAPWEGMSKKTSQTGGEDEVGPGLQEWLEEVYLEGREAEAGFSKEDLMSIGSIVGRMLRIEPRERAEASDILRDSWFQAS